MEDSVTKVSNLRENRKYPGKRIKFEGKIMSSIMNTILKYLCGGIQEVIGEKVLIVWKEARTGAMIDTWVTF